MLLTKNVPIIDAIIPVEASNNGYIAPSVPYAINPNVIADIIEPTYDSNKSAPIPATSPTLSPTLSAITAGFLGSSSGIPASTLPTKSAPTSAAFVYIPPPTRPKSAIDEAPNPNPVIIDTSLNIIYNPPTPINPKPTTDIPITAPPEKATFNALFIPDCLAAFAVLTFALVATLIPKYPANAENVAPIIKLIAVCQLIPTPRITNNTTVNIASALYSLDRKAIAPSCM